MSARTGQKGVSRGVVARPAARYRPGRLPEGANLAAEAALLGDSDEEEGVQNEHRAQHDDGDGGTQESLTSFGIAGPSRLLLQQRKTAHIRVDLGSVQIGKKVEPQYDSDEYETDTDEEPAPPKPTFRKPGAGGPPAASTIKKEESSEYETDSEEEDSEEEDEQPAPLLKPVFVPKRLRGTTGAVQAVKEKEDVAAAEDKALKAAQKRKQESHLLAAETIKRELAESQFIWFGYIQLELVFIWAIILTGSILPSRVDPEEHEENVPDLSDTDGKDPEAEFQAWRLRELQRIKRTKEAEAEREREQEEMERRRAMPEEERLAEDLKRAKESRDAKPKGQQRFMQKYYHKGAFFQDLDILKKHDFTEATEGSVDVSKLPSMMQVRDYGKRSRSKWT
ncbi:hypothetical protein OC846_001085 [Tilletia horrida]|uniref:Micro-fibrillar-associated protein 1 C-terminal domain-containing protein n=1 Tax=Tilletia horrida TaxID=155126 RepID=A0AAN6JU43_9BASI|nr:hypothetical protein OC845_003750 [Tilletia horrida]KAK0556518.1 hypothetical protein OC846_001085 [Tilletia horrida]